MRTKNLTARERKVTDVLFAIQILPGFWMDQKQLTKEMDQIAITAALGAANQTRKAKGGKNESF